MNKIKTLDNYQEKTFEDIKHIEDGHEYWFARELYLTLEYASWNKFLNVIRKAKIACTKSNNNSDDHFSHMEKMVKTGDSFRKVVDYKLSRYACYLIVQNADSNKRVVALGQTYFAIQTRKQELNEIEFNLLSENEKRFYIRRQTKDGNYSLQQVAKKAGVKNMDQFHNASYKGLYNGESADDIFKRKKLRYREDILDNMGSSELAANLFRITQAEEKLVNENISCENEAKDAHYQVGKNVRDAIAKNNGTMPENLPTPSKSLKQLEKEEKIKLVLVGSGKHDIS